MADNWRWDQFYNVPIDEMMEILDYALENGYTISWGADGALRDGLSILDQCAGRSKEINSDLVSEDTRTYEAAPEAGESSRPHHHR